MKFHLLPVALASVVALSCGNGNPGPGPLGPETCDNGKDDNGDGKTDCADPKCFSNAKCKVRVEVCDNGIDDDGNGDVDCNDATCDGFACGMGCTCRGVIRTETACGDGLDNDGDNSTDCMDPDCTNVPPCGSGAGGGSGTGGGLGTGGGSSGTGGGSSGTGGGSSGTGGGGSSGTGGGSSGTGGGSSGTGGGTSGGAGTGLDGAPCTADTQCAGGKCFTEAATGYPRGLCTNADSAPCTNWPSNAGCHGGRCVNNRCFAPCTGRGLMSPEITCRVGYACADVIDLTNNNNSICVGLCTSDAECAGSNGSFGCNPWSKYCELKDRGKTKYGGPCVNSSDCESGACYTGTGWPGGYCVGNCRGDLNNCGPNGYCQYDYASFGDNVGVCGQACTTLGALCRAANGVFGPTEYRCYQDSVGMQMGKYCDCKGTGAACSNNVECCTGSCGNIISSGSCD